jgi:Carboxypeptidase regulatory-like domain
MVCVNSNWAKAIGKTLTAAVLLGATAILPVTNAHAANWSPNDDDSLLLDVRSARFQIGNGVRGYQKPNGVCVDLADIIMAFDLPVRLDKKSRRATGWLFEESRLFTLDRDQNRVQIMNKSSALAADDLIDSPEGYCVDTKTLGRWLDVDLQADLSNSVLIIAANRKLPFELAEERKQRAGKVRPVAQFNLESLPQAKAPYKFWQTPSVDVSVNTAVRRDSLGGTSGSVRYELLASGEIAKASVEARLSSDDRGVPDALRLRAYRSDPKAQLLGPLRATHFGIGDISTPATALATQTTSGRGAIVTNRPLDRPDMFDRTTFRGELPAGWDAELYRNDQLIGFAPSRGDGRYEFVEVPLQFGQNRFEIVLYGPQGQVRRDRKLIPVGIDSIPPQKTYYWAAIQDAGHDLINASGTDPTPFDGWRGGFGVERGIDARTSISASATSSIYRGQRRKFAEISLRRAVGPALIELAGASDFAKGLALRSQALAQIGQTSISAEASFLKNGYQSERFDLDINRFVSLAIDQNLKLGGSQVALRIEAQQKHRINGDQNHRLNANLSFNINAINISSELRWEFDHSGQGLGDRNNLLSVTRLSGRVGGLRLRGEAQFGLSGQTGFRQSNITAEWRSGERSDWRAELGYDAPTKRSRLALGYVRKFEQFALTARAEIASDGSMVAGLNAAFSIGPDPRNGGFRMASEKLASMGQAFAVVFQDENADGIRQPDEPLEKAVELTAGLSGRGAPTDALGRTVVDGLLPYQPILIGIDGSTLSDPFMQPATDGVVVVPRPGVPMRIELPLVAAGEISGSLRRESGSQLSGVEIELVNPAGRVIKSTRSEYDGYFLFESVPYGRYQLRIAALTANVVGVQTQLPALAELKKGQSAVDVGALVAKAALRVAQAEPAMPNPAEPQAP